MTQEWDFRLKQLEAHTSELSEQGKLDGNQLKRIADLRAVTAFRLRPVPNDPVAQVRNGYAYIRPRLERLDEHASTDSVSISDEVDYVYTFRPRTMLRRVLDHALDHLNQIDQWVDWQATGQAPKPTDGWASSEDYLDEDILPLTRRDLEAWLWRIDIAWRMLADRAERLSSAQLVWMPPDDDWNLARVLHHVSQGFYVAWLDDPLPKDPTARYAEATRRLHDAIAVADRHRSDPEVIWLAADAVYATPDDILAQLIETEAQLIRSA
ncbi:MAG TPA: DinB family protein [Nitrolancea sp.]|nr:DinB family protein [Nitrolancea sp.]